MSHWKELNWTFPVLSSQADLKFTVASKSVEIGKVVLTAINLKNIPKDKNGLRDVCYLVIYVYVRAFCF